MTSNTIRVDLHPSDVSRLQSYYDRIRPYLPRRKGTYRGYVARDDRLFDMTTSRPDYKAGMVDSIREHAPDADVTLVGFGRGITSMIAIEAGATSVTAYEGAKEMIDIGIEAFNLNDVETARLTVRHAIVGDPVELFGTPEGATTIPPSDLATGDVLVLDCEGAELSILEGLTDVPKVAIVETHPSNGADAETICELVRSLGLNVETVPYQPRSSAKSVIVGIAN